MNRAAFVPVLVLGAMMSISTAIPASDGPTRHVDIPAQPLGNALRQLADQTGLQLAVETSMTIGKTAPAVKGDFSAHAALERLLKGSGLQHKFLDAQTVAVSKINVTSHVGHDSSSIRVSRNTHAGSTDPSRSADSDRLEAAGRSPDQAESQREKRPEDIQELVVTAQKRTERLQDVPSSISVLSGEKLSRASLTSLSEYASYVPGMSVLSGGSPGQSRIVLRGINTNDVGQPPLVGTYIDESPVGSSTGGLRSSQYAADLMPYDIERIEVLRGPQGTLYGAATMGGLLKYVLREPDLQRFSGQTGADLQTIDHSQDTGWALRAAVSGPVIEDKLGVRLSGFYNDVPGYVDNVRLARDDENSGRFKGGRAAVLWRPVEELKVKASAMLQESESAGKAAVLFDSVTLQPQYDDYVTSTARPEPFRSRLQFYSLTVDWDLGFASLTSASSLMKKQDNVAQDASRFSPLIPVLTNGAFAAAPISADLHFELKQKLTQELRLTSPSDRELQWQLGFFWTDEDAFNYQLYHPFTTAGEPIADYPLLIEAITPSTYKERAGFADLTYKFTQRLDINAGVRYAHNSQVLDSTIDGLLIGSTRVKTPSSDNVVTWSASSRFHVTPDAMFYVRVASGYRPGGANFFPNTPVYGPDRLVNYETGFKGWLMDGRLQLDGSLFYIDWSDLQVTQIDPRGFIYTGNGGAALSRGVELTAGYRIGDLRIGGTLAFTDAHLTTDAPGIGGTAGDQLPGSARWAGSVTADYSRPVNGRWLLLFGGSYSYRDEIKASVVSNARRTPVMDHRVDLNLGLEMNALTTRLYVKNVFGEESYSQIYLTPYLFGIPDPPRTVGLSFDYQF